MRKPIDIITEEAARRARDEAPDLARTGLVSAIGSDGTITVTVADSTYPAVRLLGCAPAVGDLVTILRTAGGWVCVGAQAASTTAWVTPTLVAPFVPYSGSGVWRQARYRRVGDEVQIEGVVGASGTIPASPTIFVLAEGYRPQASVVAPTVRNGLIARQLTIQTDGAVVLQNAPAEAITYVSVACKFAIS